MATVTLGTIYKSELDEEQNKPNRNIQPTLTIDDGIVNVYISLNKLVPANVGAMYLDSTLDATGTTKSFIFTGMCRWVAFVQSSGTSTDIRTQGIIPFDNT